MLEADIIVIGAGASGLMATRELAKAGKKVTILEARDRIGGRIYTQEATIFSVPTEAGAEFVHGDLPVTQAIFKEAGVLYYPMEGKAFQVKHGELEVSDDFIDDFSELISKLDELQQDMPLALFLEQYFNEERYQALRESVTKFAEGYDAADAHKVSVFALREEWLTGGATNSFFPKGGYGQVMDFLADEVKAADCVIHLSCIVKEVHYKQNYVEIITESGLCFIAKKAIITVPLGVLLSEEDNKGHINFYPALPEKAKAFQLMGLGHVIKILLEFKSAFWEDESLKHQVRQMQELSFLLSDATPVPTWWTHLPEKSSLLTGWLAGPEAHKLQHLSEDELIAKALDCLAYIFNTDTLFLKELLLAKQVINWVTDPFARGAYAYATVHSTAARKVVSQPVEDALFFAGEALYVGHAMGTVEAALASGLEVANKIINSES